MTDPTCTVEDVLSWDPCAAYDEARIRELFAGRERLSAREILALDIPANDRMWAALQPELIDERLIYELVWRIGYGALLGEVLAGRAVDDRSVAAVMVRRAWCAGDAALTDVYAASSAAWSAAESADRSAAWSAAWSAAESADRSAAWSAAESAAESAASSAAWSADRSAAWSAAWSAQIECLLRLLGGKFS